MAVSRMALVAIVVVVVVVAGLATYFLTLPKAPGPAVTPTPTPVVTPTPAPGPAPQLRSVKVAILYDPSNPVLKLEGEAAKLAIDEINAGGGILGVKVDYKTWNTMRRVDVAVSAYREAVVDWGAQYVLLEGVTEEMIALMEEGAKLYPQYPHILMYCGMGADVTIKVINEYDKYKFAFRIYTPDYAGNVIGPSSIFWNVKNVIKVNKIALLIEAAAWTEGARKGARYETKHGVIEQKPVRDIAREAGLEVVYEAEIPVGEKDFLKYLEIAYAKGAELIYVISSWYTDTTTLAKQWATSKARDIYLVLYGGTNAWTIFWDLTGGAALGVLSPITEFESPEDAYPPVAPPTPYYFSVVKKMHEKGLRVDGSAHYYYSAVYHVKEAIEYVARQGRDPNNIDEVIKALETVPCSAHTLLPKDKARLGLTELKVGDFVQKGLFHSYPAGPVALYQFQGRDKFAYIGYGIQNPYVVTWYPEDFIREHYVTFGTFSPPKPPSELRKALGIS